jgi:4-amino-4-deoxy-L-arabinose transferase-like glycosyltransferase
LYGGTFDALAEVLVAISPMEPRNSRHLANALAGLIGLWGCRQVARRVGGPAAGFWAALFLVVCAPYYGHMFINAKDIPFAAGYVWGLYFLLRVGEQFPLPSRRNRLLLGLVIGLTLGVRIGGVLLIFYGLLMGLAQIVALFAGKASRSEIGKQSVTF